MNCILLNSLRIVVTGADRRALLAFCIIANFAVTVIGLDAHAGMVLEYRLNAGQGMFVADTSGNHVDSTLSTAPDYTPPVWTEGYSAAGLQFNGTSDLLWVDDRPSLDISHFTMMAWVNYAPSPIPSERRLEVLEKAGAYWMNIRMDTRKLRVGGIFGIDHEWAFLDTMTAIPEDSWTHVAGTYDGVTMKTYVNGNLSSTKTVTKDVVSNDQALIVGAKYQVTNDPDPANDPPGVNRPGALFNGTIDELRVFDTAITQNEIQTYMNTLILPGDFNVDADVDGNDFLAWQRGYGIENGALDSDGDYDNDRDVDQDDLFGWQSEFGLGSGSTITVVPEPTSWLLFAVGLTIYLTNETSCRGKNKRGII